MRNRASRKPINTLRSCIQFLQSYPITFIHCRSCFLHTLILRFVFILISVTEAGVLAFCNRKSELKFEDTIETGISKAWRVH